MLYKSCTRVRYLAVYENVSTEPNVNLRHRQSEYTRREENRTEQNRTEQNRTEEEEKRREEKRREGKMTALSWTSICPAVTKSFHATFQTTRIEVINCYTRWGRNKIPEQASGTPLKLCTSYRNWLALHPTPLSQIRVTKLKQLTHRRKQTLPYLCGH